MSISQNLATSFVFIFTFPEWWQYFSLGICFECSIKNTYIKAAVIEHMVIWLYKHLLQVVRLVLITYMGSLRLPWEWRRTGSSPSYMCALTQSYLFFLWKGSSQQLAVQVLWSTGTVLSAGKTAESCSCCAQMESTWIPCQKSVRSCIWHSLLASHACLWHIFIVNHQDQT